MKWTVLLKKKWLIWFYEWLNKVGATFTPYNWMALQFLWMNTSHNGKNKIVLIFKLSTMRSVSRSLFIFAFESQINTLFFIVILNKQVVDTSIIKLSNIASWCIFLRFSVIVTRYFDIFFTIPVESKLNIALYIAFLYNKRINKKNVIV